MMTTIILSSSLYHLLLLLICSQTGGCHLLLMNCHKLQGYFVLWNKNSTNWVEQGASLQPSHSYPLRLQHNISIISVMWTRVVWDALKVLGGWSRQVLLDALSGKSLIFASLPANHSLHQAAGSRLGVCTLFCMQLQYKVYSRYYFAPWIEFGLQP